MPPPDGGRSPGCLQPHLLLRCLSPPHSRRATASSFVQSFIVVVPLRGCFPRPAKHCNSMTCDDHHHPSCCNFRTSCSVSLRTKLKCLRPRSARVILSLACARGPPLKGLHGQQPKSRYSIMHSSRIQAHLVSMTLSQVSHVSP